MPYVNLEDVTIHYEEAGSGSLAYVFCPGLGGDGRGFVEHLDFWAGHFPRAVTWDYRGAGQSSQAPKYNLPLFAADLAAMMDALGIERAVLHGVSWGGVVVQQFALDYVERCAAIVLDSSSSEVNVAASENWYNRGEVARLGASAQVGEFRPAFSGHTASVQAAQEQGVQVKPEHLDSYVASARAIAGLREHPFTPRLRQITCPAPCGGRRAGRHGRRGRLGDPVAEPAQCDTGDLPGRGPRRVPAQARTSFGSWCWSSAASTGCCRHSRLASNNACLVVVTGQRGVGLHEWTHVDMPT